MKKLPSNFTMQPGQNPHSYFRNLCIEFIKLLKESDDVDLLQDEMGKLINASKDMKWNEDHNKPLKQEAGEKAISKLFNEFRRYVNNLRNTSSKSNYQDLLDAFSEIERMLNKYDIK